jgi:hypothetical protein
MSICPICDEDASMNIPFKGKTICTSCFGELVLQGLLLVQDSIKAAKPEHLRRIIKDTLKD